MRHTLFALGRGIFGGYFLYNGINHFRSRSHMSAYAAAKGTPAPEAAVLGSGALLLAGGLSVIAGVKPRQGLAALITFLIPVSMQMHRFWEEKEPMARQSEQINFMKNMALVGAALSLMEVRRPWPASLERTGAARRVRSQTSYPLLTPRNLRALPA
jgi:uncharacterized membrane protein YphA (DoxX/SURF4 family)